MTKNAPPRAIPFLTIVEGRVPREKIYTSLGNAKQTMTLRSDIQGSIWEMVGGQWVLLYEVTSELVNTRGVARWVQNVPWKKR